MSAIPFQTVLTLFLWIFSLWMNLQFFPFVFMQQKIYLFAHSVFHMSLRSHPQRLTQFHSEWANIMAKKQCSSHLVEERKWCKQSTFICAQWEVLPLWPPTALCPALHHHCHLFTVASLSTYSWLTGAWITRAISPSSYQNDVNIIIQLYSSLM